MVECVGREGKVAPGPSDTCVSALGPPAVSATDSTLEDVLACPVCGREVVITVHKQVSTSQMVLGWCLRKLVQRFCLSKNDTYHHCFLQYLH